MTSESNAQEIEFRSGHAAPAQVRSRFQLDDGCSAPDSSLLDYPACDTLSDAAGSDSAASPDANPSIVESGTAKGAVETSDEKAAQKDQTEAWRREVSARITRYRSRRRSPKARYPSLLLKFEDASPFRQENAPFPEPLISDSLARAVPANELLEIDPVEDPAAISMQPPPILEVTVQAETGRILEFPRPIMPPPRPLDELAGPVIDRPRIFEVPEIAPPTPALGGISIENEQDLEERRPGFDIPLQAAPLGRRLLAAVADALVILASLGLFAVIFFRVTHIIPPAIVAATWAAGLLALFWAAYEYAFLVYGGATPGTKIAKLQLSRFDGGAVPRKIRRWRALASILSAASLGLGLAWCFLDEDQLCWHDRITRTYIAPAERPR